MTDRVEALYYAELNQCASRRRRAKRGGLR